MALTEGTFNRTMMSSLSVPGETESVVCAMDHTRTLGVSDLPEELIKYVLRYVKEAGGQKEFWNCLMTCRDWHRIGLGVHGRLDLVVSAVVQSDIHRSNFSTGGLSPMFISQIRSLTVHVIPHCIAIPDTTHFGQDLFASITKVFNITQKLSTFSCKFAYEEWDVFGIKAPLITQNDLVGLIGSLPQTVVNLEIDTAGIDIAPHCAKSTDRNNHLCSRIGEILPRLRHIRLRVNHVCEAMLPFGPSPPGCSCEGGCRLCNEGVKDFCEHMRAWMLRSFTVWLPSGAVDENSRTAHAFRRLSKVPLSLGTYFNVISQQNQRTEYRDWVDGSCCPSFTWRSDRNREDPAEGSTVVHGHTLDAHAPSATADLCFRCCEETPPMAHGPIRLFQMGEDGFPKTPFPYVAEWMLEGPSRWAQEKHGGVRYPALEGYKREGQKSDETRLWACLFPYCQSHHESLQRLRGHHFYRHPIESHIPI